ncbi:MAG TPA: phosphate/phosphite/phosphonate ABC transporter substrate-binding protein [Rhodocyclaceae bacterium]
MPRLFTVSPDFNMKYMSGWFIFNTLLQKALGEAIHFEPYEDFDSQRKAIEADRVDIIYANPYDASMLVREKGFLALARPRLKSDEAVIAVRADSPINGVEELQPGIRVATTDDPDVHMMCMIMLEPADLNRDNVQFITKDNYVVVAKELLKSQADVGFFLSETFDDLSEVIRKQLRVLVKSQIHVVHHMFLISPQLASRSEEITRVLTNMDNSDAGRRILSDIGIPGWDPVDIEEVEFMIDLMSTLVD